MDIEFTSAAAAISPLAPVGDKTGAPKTEQLRDLVPGHKLRAEDEPMEADKWLRDLEKTLADSHISLNFSRDDESGMVVIRMVDDGTGETIRQLPSEAALRIANAFGKLQGLIFNRQA